MTTELDQPSEGTRPRSKMQVVGERRVDQLSSPSPSPTLSMTPSPTTTATTIQPETLHRAAWKAGVMGALNVIIAVIAVRLIVLVAVSGGIALTWLALQNPDLYRLGALAIYCGAVVVPSVWLSSSGR